MNVNTWPWTPIAATLIAIIIVLFSLPKLDNFLRNTAVDGCAQNARKTSEEPNKKVSEVDQHIYRYCLKDKGIETSLPQ